MYCKMDVDDLFVYENQYRKMGCACAVRPAAPSGGCGCQCPDCGKVCRECLGFGYVSLAPRRFHEILSRVRAQIRKRVSLYGRPPGFLRLREEEIDVVIRKFEAEDPGHFVRTYVDPGPPLRIYDVLIVPDRRKRIR